MITQDTHTSLMRRLGMAAIACVMLIAGLVAVFDRASGGAEGVQTVRIRVRHSRFIPAKFTVRNGATVRFVITNEDPIDHEFILGDEGVQLRHENGTEPKHGEIPGEVTVHAGMTAETTFTFSTSGLLLIGCHAPGHYAYGMRGWVRILP